MQRVAAIIVTHNAADVVPETLRRLRDFSGGVDLTQIVVDSGSGDESAARALEAGADQVIEAANIGYGAANNLGAKARAAAGAEWIVIVNPDCLVQSGSLESLLQVGRDPEVGVIAPLMINPDGTLQRSLVRFETPRQRLGAAVRGIHPDQRRRGFLNGSEADFDWAIGAFIVIRNSCFESVGGFDERFFLYADETDLQRRTKLAGWRHVATRALMVEHDTGLDGTRVESNAISAQRVRGEVAYARKWYGLGGEFLERAALALEITRELAQENPPDHARALRARYRMLLSERLPADPAQSRRQQMQRMLGQVH